MISTSKSTRHEDLHRKFLIYQDKLRVPEYFLFDPLGDYLQPRLQGYRLQRGKYVAIRPTGDRLKSKELGLLLQPEDDALRLIDEQTNTRLLTPRELAKVGQEEVARLRQEVERLRRK